MIWSDNFMEVNSFSISSTLYLRILYCNCRIGCRPSTLLLPPRFAQNQHRSHHNVVASPRSDPVLGWFDRIGDGFPLSPGTRVGG